MKKSFKKVFAAILACTVVLSSALTSYAAEPVTLYTPEGITISVWDYEVELYKALGWYDDYNDVTTTLYAPDGRTAVVYNSQVNDYILVGWLTLDAYNYLLVSTDCNNYISSGEYEKAINVVENYLYLFAGTDYEYAVALLKLNAINQWHDLTGEPMTYTDYLIYESDENFKVNISLRNLTSNTVTSFIISFDCYNELNEYINNHYSYYFVDKTDHSPYVSKTYAWQLSGMDKVSSIGNIRILKATFADGTVWTNE